LTWEVPSWIGLWDKVNLRQLILGSENKVSNEVTEIVADIHPRMREPLREISLPFTYEDPANVTPSKLFYLGHAFYTISQLRNIAPRVFVITNDAPENEPWPFDDSIWGWIPENALKKHKFAVVRHGFGEGGVFQGDLGFDNYLFQIEDGDFEMFVDAFLGDHMSPTVYWFAFAQEDVGIEEISKAMTSSANEDEFVLSLCRVCTLVVYGLERYVYVFLTADQKVANQLKKSFKNRD
jgi:hypothetical protein